MQSKIKNLKTYKIRSLLFTFSLLLGSIFFNSCRKGPGPGGKGTMTGRIYEYNYNSEYTVIQGEYLKGDHDVFLQYDGENTYGEKTSTHYNGVFEFKYLLPGKYIVYTYSKDTLPATPFDIVILREVEIEKKESIDLGMIAVYDN